MSCSNDCPKELMDWAKKFGYAEIDRNKNKHFWRRFLILLGVVVFCALFWGLVIVGMVRGELICPYCEKSFLVR